jgi:hypothetical protein
VPQGLLLAVSAVSTVRVIYSVSRVDFSVVLLLLHGPLTMRLKESSPDFRSLNACVSDREQICHYLGLFHSNLLNSLDVVTSIVKGIDDLDVLDIRGSVPSAAKIFQVVPEDFIMLLSHNLQSLSSRWMLIHALEVPDEHDT